MSTTPSQEPRVRHVLWTSGWDSTYRVLDLLHSSRDIVQPYYLYSFHRLSVRREIRSMHNMLLLMRKNPDWDARLRHPLLRLAYRYQFRATPYEEAYEKITQKIHLGKQYMYLAAYRDAEQIPALELSLVKGQGAAYNYLKEFVVTDSDGNYILGPDAPDYVQLLFKGFHLPLMYTSKVEMIDLAKEKGFDHIHNLSWFCHKPIERRPCGTCPPCLVTIRSGLACRVGDFGMERYHALIAEKGEDAALTEDDDDADTNTSSDGDD